MTDGIVSQVNSAWLDTEDGAFGAIDDDTGAGMLYIPARTLVMPGDTSEPIQIAAASGRNKRPAHKRGRESAELSLDADLSGNVVSVIVVGDPPTTKDSLDRILDAILGLGVERNGSLVGVGSSVSSLVTATDEIVIGDLIAVLNAGCCMWARAGASSSPYSVAPNFPRTPAENDPIPAGRTWSPNVVPGSADSVGPTLSLVVDMDGKHYAVLGGRPSSLSFTMAAGGECSYSVGFLGNQRLRQTFANLPDPPINPNPCIGKLSTIKIDGTEYDVGTLTLEFGLAVSEIKSTAGAQGRSGFRVKGVHPRLSLDPLNTDDFEDLFAANDPVNCLVQFGEGATGAAFNSLSYFAEGVQVARSPKFIDDDGELRQNVEILPADMGATGVNAFYWQLGKV